MFSKSTHVCLFLVAAVGVVACADEPTNDPEVTEEETDRVERILALADSEDLDAQEAGPVYHETCFQCHSYNGLGSSDLSNGRRAVDGMEQGRRYVVELLVDGRDPGGDLNPMPSFAHLDDEDIAGIVLLLEGYSQLGL